MNHVYFRIEYRLDDMVYIAWEPVPHRRRIILAPGGIHRGREAVDAEIRASWLLSDPEPAIISGHGRPGGHVAPDPARSGSRGGLIAVQSAPEAIAESLRACLKLAHPASTELPGVIRVTVQEVG